jgi:hypothetical protein
MDLVEVGWGDVDWIGLAQDRDRWRALVNSVLNLRVPYNVGKLRSVLTTRDLSSSARLCREREMVNVEILERFQSKALRMITDAPWYVMNALLRSYLHIPSVKKSNN